MNAWMDSKLSALTAALACGAGLTCVSCGDENKDTASDSTPVESSRFDVKAGSVDGKYEQWVRKAAERCDRLRADVIAAQIEQESNWDPKAVSSIGAQGIAQFLPDTWKAFGVDANGDGKKDPFDPPDGIVALGNYMCHLYDEMGSGASLTTVLWAYNAGPEATKKAGGKAPTAEAENYARRIENDLVPKYRP
jgi:soluble lytic murein transglycosylase-like protein